MDLILYGSLAAFLLYAIYELCSLYLRPAKNVSPSPSDSENNVQDVKNEVTDPFHITPLPDFDWKTTEPVKIRNFKPKYHLTMGVETSSFSELLEFDRNYLSRITLRRQIIREHHDIAIQADPNVTPALQELYSFLISSYLPARLPTMVTLHSTTLLNRVTGDHLPLTPPEDAVDMWEILGSNIDDDFLIMLKSEDGDGYVLKGYVTCFPAGFDTREKMGRKLRDIHSPVPGYKAKLEKSMDRFFDRLPVGQVVKRSNWSINTSNRLFAPSGLHSYEGESAEEEEVDPDTTFLRVERQILHRLPETKALVFSFKTYLYLVRDVRDEGLGEDLADAIEGLKGGSVPEMHFYKRGAVWGESVKRFLRS